jgi:hypothetical protein
MFFTGSHIIRFTFYINLRHIYWLSLVVICDNHKSNFPEVVFRFISEHILGIRPCEFQTSCRTRRKWIDLRSSVKKVISFLLLLPFWSIILYTVGLLGRVISTSQGLCLNTGLHKHRKTHTHTKHRCPEWDSSPRSRLPSERRQYMS